MRKYFIIFLSIVFAVTALTGCFTVKKQQSNDTEINPKEESANLEKMPVMLYFQYGDEFLLAGEPRTIDAPVNGRIENAVIHALVQGPEAESQGLNALLDPGTKVVNVTEEGEYLFVTLSGDFIKSEITDENEQKKMQLAVYSLVNTLIELGGYARVQLRVDKDGSGIGQSITKAETGFGNTEDALEPLGFYSPVVLNPKNTVNEFMKNYANKDWEKVYESIAEKDITGDEKPNEEEFLSGVVSFQYGIEEFEVQDYYIAADNKTAVVLVDFSLKTKRGENEMEKNMPVKLVRENNVWRISYSSFKKVFSF